MPSNWNYAVFVDDGDRAIVDPNEAERCPYGLKVALVDRPLFSAAVESVWDRYSLTEYRGIRDHTRSNANNIQELLCATFPSTRICAYHLGRGMAAAVLEVLTGFACDQYSPFKNPLGELIERVTVEAPRSFTMEAQNWLGKFMTAGESGGSPDFVALWRNTDPFAKKKKKKWRQ